MYEHLAIVIKDNASGYIAISVVDQMTTVVNVRYAGVSVRYAGVSVRYKGLGHFVRWSFRPAFKCCHFVRTRWLFFG